MLQEHALGRSYIAQMSETLEAKNVDGFNAVAANYCDLLRNHIEKEDRILFTLADQTIDEVGQEQLFEEFEKFEENVIGHEQLIVPGHPQIDFCSLGQALPPPLSKLDRHLPPFRLHRG